MSARVWIVEAEHSYVPGRRVVVCASKARADAEAADLLNLIVKRSPPYTAKTWRRGATALEKRLHGRAYVESTSHEVRT